MKVDLNEIKAKLCYACKETKGSNEFYKCKTRPDGLRNICKACDSAQSSKRKLLWQKENPEKHRQYMNEYQSRPEVKQKEAERYRKRRTENHAVIRAREIEKAKTPHDQARKIFRNAVAAGKLKRNSECEQCGSKENIEGHHEDYNKPLEVKWLCRKCHRNLHRQEA
jgi:hypothetical protein